MRYKLYKALRITILCACFLWQSLIHKNFSRCAAKQKLPTLNIEKVFTGEMSNEMNSEMSSDQTVGDLCLEFYKRLIQICPKQL